MNIIGMTLFAVFGDLKARIEDRQEGATAVEYGLMVALIAVVIIVAVKLLGTNVSNTFNTTANAVQ